MKNSRSPTHSPSFLSDSSSEPSESPDNLSDHQLKHAQDFFDGILNYLLCTNDDIIEIANQIEKNFSTAELLIEMLNNQKVLLDVSKNNGPSEILIQEKSPLGKRPNPFLGVLDKESLVLESAEDESILEEYEDDSIDSEGLNDDFDDLSTSTDIGQKSYQDQQTQTSPIIPLQSDFPLAPQYFLCFSVPIQEQNTNDKEVKPQEKEEISLPTRQFHGSTILVQPMYFIEPQQTMASRIHEPRNEREEFEQQKEFKD